MKTFHFVADCTFEAESIDDACMKLSKHFSSLLNYNLQEIMVDIPSGSFIVCPPEELQFIGRIKVEVE